MMIDEYLEQAQDFLRKTGTACETEPAAPIKK